MISKQWVIPDIHGCKKTLCALITDKVKLNKSDTLYFLGDYIDRGPDSKGVIDYIRSLNDVGFNVRLLKGNHESYLLKALSKKPMTRSLLRKKDTYQEIWSENYWKSTLNSFGVQNIYEIPEDYIQWIERLEYFIEIKDFILVHAGLNFDIDNPFEDKQSMLWVREYEIIPEKINYRKIIHGHVPFNLEFIQMNIESQQFDFIALDNGVYIKNTEGFGNLLALELNTMELLVQPNID